MTKRFLPIHRRRSGVPRGVIWMEFLKSARIVRLCSADKLFLDDAVNDQRRWDITPTSWRWHIHYKCDPQDSPLLQHNGKRTNVDDPRLRCTENLFLNLRRKSAVFVCEIGQQILIYRQPMQDWRFLTNFRIDMKNNFTILENLTVGA